MFKQYARKRRLSDDEKETVGIKKAKKQTNNLIFNKLLIVDYYQTSKKLPMSKCRSNKNHRVSTFVCMSLFYVNTHETVIYNKWLLDTLYNMYISLVSNVTQRKMPDSFGD